MFFRAESRAVFAFGFAKSDRDNIGPDHETDLKRAVRIVLSFTQDQVDQLVVAGALIEVKRHGQGQKNLPQ